MSEERKMKHNITMEERSKIAISGVIDVFAFDEDNIIMETELGVLSIGGNNLHVNKLSLESGQLEVEGEIDGISYNQPKEHIKTQGSFLTKLFR